MWIEKRLSLLTFATLNPAMSPPSYIVYMAIAD